MKRFFLVGALVGSSLLPVASQAQPKNVAKSIAVVGIVTGPPQGDQFKMRANGQIYRVTVLPKVSLAKVQGGDRVRVWGIPTRLTLQRANVRILTKGASSSPDDYSG